MSGGQDYRFKVPSPVRKIWVEGDKDEFSWTLTDFLNLCVSKHDGDVMFVSRRVRETPTYRSI